MTVQARNFRWMGPLRAASLALVLSLAVGGAPELRAAEKKAADVITMNVQEADIRVLIQWMAQQLGRNVIIDPRVKGNVTVHAGEPMDRDTAYKVFESVLQVHGYAVVDTGESLKIIPDVNAKQSEIPVVSGKRSSGDEMVVRVVRVRNVSAVQLVALLRPLIPQVGHLAAYPSTNVLVISDRAANIQRIVAIIDQIDKAGELDVEIVPLKNADAGEVIEVLKSMVPGTGGAGDGGGVPVGFAADRRSNSILMSGDALMREQVRNLIRQLDSPVAGEGNTQVIYLHYARAEELVPILQSITGSIQNEQGDKGGVARGVDSISIEAAEATNAVIITAPPSVQRSLHSVIKQLDIRRAQVLVEAVIVEVSDEVLDALGVEWGTGTNPLNGNVPGWVGGSRTGTANTGDFDGYPGSPPDLLGGLSLGYFKGGTLRSLIRALDNDTNTNILSTPSLVTLDNEEAEILVGQNVPFVTGSSTQTGAGVTNPFQTIERNDVGITLRIRPHINHGDAITLEVEQEVSAVTTSVTAADIVTNKRSIKTHVLIEDDQILVLGGLIDDQVTETVNKVPILGDLPVVGHLFKTTQIDNDKTNLMVFIHPVILKDQVQSDKITKSRYELMRDKEQEFNENMVDFFSIDSGPELPPFEEKYR